VRPTPRTRTLTDSVAEFSVRLEVIEVNVVALVSLIGISLNSLNAAMLAGKVALAGPLLGEAAVLVRIEVSCGTLSGPCCLLYIFVRIDAIAKKVRVQCAF
jgi:hypothetical protein